MIAPQETMPNIVATFAAGKPGRHLALNGHIDVFPVGDGEGWTQDPWGGALVDGRIYGRGACDMKCGTTASIFTFLYLHELREELYGRLTLSAVSDEETFGPWGARYLGEHHPEVFGDCCLNGEPSSPWTLRFGEKGPLWIEFTVRTRGAHGAYTHLSKSATAIAARIIGELYRLENILPPEADNLCGNRGGALAEVRASSPYPGSVPGVRARQARGRRARSRRRPPPCCHLREGSRSESRHPASGRIRPRAPGYAGSHACPDTFCPALPGPGAIVAAADCGWRATRCRETAWSFCRTASARPTPERERSTPQMPD